LSDPRINHVKNEILASGTDDWVHIAEVVFFAREAMFGDRLEERYPNDASLSVERLAEERDRWSASQERTALPLAIVAVKELLREQLVRVGETIGRAFVPWSGSLAEIESRIDAAAENAVFPLLPGHLFWLENTPAGNERAAIS